MAEDLCLASIARVTRAGEQSDDRPELPDEDGILSRTVGWVQDSRFRLTIESHGREVRRSGNIDEDGPHRGNARDVSWLSIQKPVAGNGAMTAKSQLLPKSEKLNHMGKQLTCWNPFKQRRHGILVIPQRGASTLVELGGHGFRRVAGLVLPLPASKSDTNGARTKRRIPLLASETGEGGVSRHDLPASFDGSTSADRRRSSDPVMGRKEARPHEHPRLLRTRAPHWPPLDFGYTTTAHLAQRQRRPFTTSGPVPQPRGSKEAWQRVSSRVERRAASAQGQPPL
ncbi:uncharacterized protein BJ171DRAFT_476094 [Polychytrium aggregatum]|uniref:uncharacterized protein n=1 Tax=Polychytrium aggregatum TaxID=110093 RepID=UPI0022FE96AE|nr:uncharacterized protein BJ171DRAFT_476094 [Polychytrium aggregatum]KAI9203159.1 hypothetical protein BJ171DRAFT_476094 [Polychytrium aggregatum]